MPVFLNATDPNFEAEFQTLLSAKREDSPDVDQVVADIIADVRARGDAALLEYTERFDRLSLTPETLRLSGAEIAAEIQKVAPEDRAALELAADRIRAYHAEQMPQDAWWKDASGAELGWRWTPVSAAGLYVPGGLATYPSSVLMNAIPAKVAGVERLAITVPTPGGAINPLVILAAELAGVDEIYRIGGAQAIAALAYGTSSVAAVDKITGPGNAFVAAAKRRVFGKVGIDMIAGPSEILVIADKDNSPDWIALDFASWRDYGSIILVSDMDQAVALSDRIAPEHLEICVDDAMGVSEKIHHAGAIFIGAWTPEAIGDYVGGPNHVLPTARSARFSSGLSVMDFVKRTTLSRMTPDALAQIGPAAERLASSEGLEAHGLSVTARLKQINTPWKVKNYDPYCTYRNRRSKPTAAHARN